MTLTWGNPTMIEYDYRPERIKWENCIKQLKEWQLNPPDWEDDIVVPTPEIFELSVRTAEYFLRTGSVGHERVLPDGEGGFVFERRSDEYYDQIAVEKSGNVGLILFKDGEIVFCENIEIE